MNLSTPSAPQQMPLAYPFHLLIASAPTPTEDESDSDNESPPAPDHSQKALQLVKDRLLCKATLESIPPKSSYRAWFLGGQGYGSAPWLLHSSHGKGLLGLKALAFTENLRLRLLLPIFNLETENSSWSCQCGSRLYPLQHGFDDHHGLGCRNAVLLKCWRHDRIKDFLVSQLQRLISSAGTVETLKVDIPGRNGSPGKRADIMVSLSRDVFFIDLAITNNGCQTARRAGSCSKSGKAALLKEASKTRQWSKVFDPTQLDRCFVPFVIEAGGRHGTKATDFLDKICGLEQLTHIPNHSVATARRSLLRGIASINAHHNALLMERFHNASKLTPFPKFSCPLSRVRRKSRPS